MNKPLIAKSIIADLIIVLLVSVCAKAQSDDLRIQILQMCIDTAANKNEPYYIDFSKDTFWSGAERESFFQKNPLFEPGNIDSIIKYDKKWIEYEVLSQKIIFVRGVRSPEPDQYIVSIDHLWSSDGSH